MTTNNRARVQTMLTTPAPHEPSATVRRDHQRVAANRADILDVVAERAISAAAPANVADMAVPGLLAWLDDGCPDVKLIRGKLSRLRRHGVGPGLWAKIRDRLISWGEREIERRMVAGGPIDDADEIGRQCRAVALGLADSNDDAEPLNVGGIARCPDCGSTALEREQVRAGVLGCVECMWVQPKGKRAGE